MKKSRGFWPSLEGYAWKVVGRSPLPRLRESAFAQTVYSGVLRFGRFGEQAWPLIAVGMLILVFLTSFLTRQNSVASAGSRLEVILKAVELGDYALAERLYQTKGDQVLGAYSGVEDQIYPERKISRRIAELETKLVEYPGNREIYLALATLYGQLDNQTKASEYREKARILDPNH